MCLCWRSKTFWLQLVDQLIFNVWDNIFKNGPSKISGRQSSKNITWSVLEYTLPCVIDLRKHSTALKTHILNNFLIKFIKLYLNLPRFYERPQNTSWILNASFLRLFLDNRVFYEQHRHLFWECKFCSNLYKILWSSLRCWTHRRQKTVRVWPWN